MAKSSFEKTIEKALLHQTAKVTVEGQPQIGGMRVMDQEAEEVFKVILSYCDENEDRNISFCQNVIPKKYQKSLDNVLNRLNMYGVIANYSLDICGNFKTTLTSQGLTYFEDKKKAQEKEEKMGPGKINIGNITTGGGNVFFGDITNSSISIDNSISNVMHEIEERGGDDAEELKAILEEVKELIENIDDSRRIPKNKGLFQRITGHFDKHSWFYAEIVSLLGTAAMGLLKG